jgi:hypothetical protein
MRFAKFVVGGATAAAAVPLGALPAYAKGVPVPAGCTFNGSTGQTTCVTTQQSATTVAGPITVNPPTIVDGNPAANLCGGPNPNLVDVLLFGSLTETTTTTTTTVHQGVSPRGHQVSQSTVTQSTFSGHHFVGCAFIIGGGGGST